MKIGVMEGKLSEFDLAAVLQVVGLGRQYTGIEVQRSDGQAGTIYVKSGVIVSVHAPPDEGKRAFFRLFGDNKGRFHVFRMDTPPALPTPLGQVQKLLMEALTAAVDSGDSQDAAPVITVSTSEPPARPPSVLPFADLEVATSAAFARNGLSPASPEPARPPLQQPPPPPPAAVPPPAPSSRAASNVRQMPAPVSVRPAPPAPRLASVPPHPAGDGSPGHVIAIVSPKGGCGKTTIALNTAIALARQGHKIVLVDGDINGDVLSSLNARSRSEVGTFDVLVGNADVQRGLLPTIVPNLKILPAVGARLPDPDMLGADLRGRVRNLLNTLSRDGHVIVDTPAGMFGFTRQVLMSSSHTIAVLQAELVAHRSFERFREALASIPATERPHVLGVVLNMLQMRHGGSLSVLQNVCVDLPADWLFETSIPRHNAIVDATAQGVPIRHLDERSPPAVAFLFDTLASEIAQRLRLSPPEYRPQSLLL